MKEEGHRRPRLLRQDKTVSIYMRRGRQLNDECGTIQCSVCLSWSFVETSSLYKLLNAYFIAPIKDLFCT